MRVRPIRDQYARLPWLIAAMTAAALAIGAIATFYIEGRLVESKGETLALAASEVAHKLDLLLAEHYDDTLELSRDNIFEKHDPAGQSAYLATIKRIHPTYLWLGVTDAGGRIAAATDPATIGKNLGGSASFQATRDTGRVHVGDVEPFFETNGVDAVAFTAPITSPRGSFHGVITTRVGIPHLEDVITRTIQAIQARQEFKSLIDYKFATAQGAVFVDSDLPHKGNVNLEQLGLPSARLSKSGQPGYVEEEHPHRHVRVITGYARTQGGGAFPGLKWTVLLHIDKDALVAPIWKTLWKLAAAWALVWLPILGFLLWSAGRLKKEQEYVLAAESKYRQLVEQAGDIIYQTDARGYFTYVNPTVTRTKGYTPEELIGRHFTEFIRPDSREAAKRFLMRQFVKQSPSVYQEFPALAKDGREIWIGQNVQPLFENDQVVGFQAVARDITERKRAEEALRETEERFQAFMTNTPAVAFMKDEAGHYIYMNRTFERAFRVTQSQIIGKTDYDWLPEALARQLCENDRTVFSSGQPLEVIETVPTPDGRSERWLVLKFPLSDASGRRLVGGVAVDITAHKQAEEENRRAHAFLDSIVENIPNMVFVKDAKDLRFVRINRAGEELLGYSRRDLIGRSDYDCFLKEEADFFTAKDREVLENKQLLDIPEEPIKTRHRGVRILRTKKIPIADQEGRSQYLLGISEDITERKRAEETQKKLIAELAESRNRFEMFFRQTPSAISITTITEGRFLDLNKQAELLTGYTREELIGRTTVEMNLYVDPIERPGLVQELKQKGMLADLEREIRTKSGEIRTGVFSLVPIQMGSEPCLLSIAHDITGRKQAEQRLYERSRQQAIEAELSMLAVTIQDSASLLSTAAGLVSNALDVHYCEVLELLAIGTDLRLCASAGWRGDAIGQVRAVETGSMAHAALNSNKPVVRTLQHNTRFGGPQWLHEHGVVSAMSVSIPGKDGPWGVLGVYTPENRAFSRDDVNFLQTVSSILATAIERMQAESVLRSANQSLRQLSRQLLQVQEDDRRAIARDLHDEIGQSLTAIKLNVERAQRTADRDARTRIMQDCAQITERVLGQVRDLSLDLHPSILDDLGLAYALKWFADRQAERAGLKVVVAADPSLPRLSQDIEIVCFRIAQEALTNVVRHACASLVGITLKRRTTGVELRIQDDGIGFVVGGASALANGGASVGLTSMQERAKLLGGTVKISSAPRCGTTVIATLPLPVVSPAGMPTEEVPRS